jgi:uridine kinase
MKSWVVGVCGGTCSGKSTLSKRVLQILGDVSSAEICFDSYYRPLDDLALADRKRINFDHPDSLDLPLFVEHLAALRGGQGVEQPLYDFERHTRGDSTRPVASAPLVLADGILLLSFAEIRELLDFAVFLDVPKVQRLGRRVARDQFERGRSEESIRAQFGATVAPMHRRFVQPSAAHADLVLDGTRPIEDLAQELAAQIHERFPAH